MNNVQCKKCIYFTPEWCPKKRDSLDPDFVRDCECYRVKTCGDVIRKMTDEELAILFAWGVDGSGKTREQWLEWLKEGVSE